MQGRLSKPVNGRIQAFPWQTWRDEFKLARSCGFDSIEFIFESKKYENNPLYCDEGLQEIERLSRKNGVEVKIVCADYFMERPLIRVSEHERKKGVKVLKHLIKQCGKIGMELIELPFVDNSEIKTQEEMQEIVKCIKQCLPLAEKCNIQVGLETTLPPKTFLSFIRQFSHPLIKANHDVGNSASLGYDSWEEILTLGDIIANIHIKDRILGGGTVSLGTGDVDFAKFFSALKKINYQGSFIIQAARGDDDVKTAKDYLRFVKKYTNKYLGAD
jgi:hexulose-6-phosphate isomerase